MNMILKFAEMLILSESSAQNYYLYNLMNLSPLMQHFFLYNILHNCQDYFNAILIAATLKICLH